MEVIAKSTVHTKRKLAKGATMAIAIFSLFSLGGCVGGGMDMLSSTKVDRSVSTGTIPTAPVTTDSVSDETTVRNAVTSADLAKLNGQPVPWANASTGSAGVIDTIVENNASGQVCRQFRTTRHSYDGIANFFGKTCLIGQGEWQLLSFQQDG
ncbi:RT0821/Lpp0805 family surface protein [Rhizobium sp. CNPSo 3464]|uniref:RT0821/Lpp0805 family surface protein n=1 Tax=Rhizobium sp. CNPSo 3464 TaxID=3021406 RepID=UPI00254BB121|nr:RT0821/Lpp0805 family surface protein [Rhizobium sp. CNPSo 3464]MDK4738780.1 RT0821/Lpp0805 family surface protein [Rhizobium sp. CNPSo 3464]